MLCPVNRMVHWGRGGRSVDSDVFVRKTQSMQRGGGSKQSKSHKWTDRCYEFYLWVFESVCVVKLMPDKGPKPLKAESLPFEDSQNKSFTVSSSGSPERSMSRLPNAPKCPKMFPNAPNAPKCSPKCSQTCQQFNVKFGQTPAPCPLSPLPPPENF